MSSTEKITVLELSEMELRCGAATPGPWDSYVVGRDIEAGSDCIATADGRFLEVIGGTPADQDFIARAREDVPKLVAEIQRLRAEIEMLRLKGNCEGTFITDARSIRAEPTTRC